MDQAEPKMESLYSLALDLRELVRAAQSARPQAYAPYSGFRVGAAVRTVDGRVFMGANVENASYGLSICAERAAVLSAVLAGARELLAVAVCSDLTPPVTPCGMCRQTLAEFAIDCQVILCGPASGDGALVRCVQLRELLPDAFSPAALHAFAAQQRARTARHTDGSDVGHDG